jgi:hypothetical protein
MATPWVNAPEIAMPCKGTLTFRIHSQFGVFMGRPYRAYCLSRTKPMAWPWAAGSLPLRGEKTPVKMKGWYQAMGSGHTLRRWQTPQCPPIHNMSNSSINGTTRFGSSVRTPASQLRRLSDLAPIPAPVRFALPT